MENPSSDEHTHLQRFLRHIAKNGIIVFCVIGLSLGIGMWGYHYFEKMSWLDAYLNAAMILGGMGPVATVQTAAGKIFAGSYALFSGIIFLVVMAILLAPVFHRVLHKFQMAQEKHKSK